MTYILIINDWISNLTAGGTYRVQGFARGFNTLGFKALITTPWGVTEYGRYSIVDQPNVGSPLYYATTGLILPMQVIRSLVKSGLPDLVLVQMPSPFTKALSILPILKLIDVPLVLDFGDPWWKRVDPMLYKYISSKLIQFQVEESMLVTSLSKLILKLINGKNKVWIPMGVDTELFKPRSVNQYDNLVGFLGLFTRRNGAELIIPILSELVKRGIDARFLLIGGGNLLHMIHKEATRKGLDRRILITGNVSRRRIPELLSICSVLVAPYMESPELHFIFPTKVPEMMALRRPVVTTRLYEIITTFKVNEEILVARYDVADYADKIELILTDPILRGKIAEKGYERIRKEFTWEKLSMKILENINL
jgi:glycosyltransferase involved in cell wall biosynthesis